MPTPAHTKPTRRRAVATADPSPRRAVRSRSRPRAVAPVACPPTWRPADKWTVDPRFARVVDLFGRLFTHGGGGALAIRWHGRTVVDVWRGNRDAAGRAAWGPDTLAMSFSTSKGAASTVIHRLHDRGLIDYDEPVAGYWPAFAAGGKRAITVRALLSHEAGLFDVGSLVRRADDLLDHELMEERIAAAKARPSPGRPAYHAITYGWLVSGLARAVTGKGIATLVQEELAQPLGTEGMHIGRPRGVDGAEIAELVGPALRLAIATGRVLAPAGRLLGVGGPMLRALYVPGFDALCMGGEPAILDAELPSVNGLFTARALAKLYEPLACGGRAGNGRLLSAATVREIGRVQSRTRDRVLALPMRWRLGYHQALVLGRQSPRAFGHYGYGGSGAWADPDSGLSLGFTTNVVGRATTPLGDLALFRMGALALAAAAEARRP